MTPLLVSIAAAGLLCVLFVLLRVSTVVSRLADQNARLAQRLALLEHELTERDEDDEQPRRLNVVG